MKQLLIVKKSLAYAAVGATGKKLDHLKPGAIVFFNPVNYNRIVGTPKNNFAIAIGRPNNSPAFVIPEVDIDTLTVNYAIPSAGAAFTATMTVPTVTAGETYTLVLIKKGTLPHERNTWTATETIQFGDTSTTASDIAAKLRNYFQAMADSGSLEIVVSGTGANVIITGKNKGEGWVLKGADGLASVAPTSVTVASPVIGDKAYIQNLASQCAAGKGFTDTYRDGDTIYPGYPEEVEDESYTVYTLRFQVGRASAKTRDEKVWQLVHIAVPSGASSADAINTILMGTGSGPDESSESSESE